MVTAPLDRSTGTLRTEQPLDLAASLHSGQAHRWKRDNDAGGDGKGPWHCGVVHRKLIKIRPSGPGELEFRASPSTAPDETASVLGRYFRLDDDIQSILVEIAGDSQVAAMVDRHRGLRLLRIDPWECLISFICSANSNIPRIHSNMESMAVNFGEPLSLDGGVRHLFPPPERLADAGEAVLRSLALGFRASYVAKVARIVADGQLDLEALRYMPYQDAKARLVDLPGVGPKIADCVLLHSLDKLEAFPIDVWVRRALAEWYFPGQKPPPNRVMLEWALEHFGPYAGYAELYLFHGRRLEKKQEASVL